jgi:hypothetical protein
MDFIPPQLKDVGTLRQAVFASMYLPRDCPNYWLIVTEFANLGSSSSVDAAVIKAMVENLQLVNADAFTTDKQLMEKIHAMRQVGDKPLGIVLVSNNNECGLCGSKLLIRGVPLPKFH